MVKIKIIEEHSIGYKDSDKSIEIPECGGLMKIIEHKDIPTFLLLRDTTPKVNGPGIVEINGGTYRCLIDSRKETIFDDYLSFYVKQTINRPSVKTHSDHNGVSDLGPKKNSLPAIEIYPFYLVWVDERKEWIGIKDHYKGCESELDGKNEFIETSGPYELGINSARFIAQAYDKQIPETDLLKILRTNPKELQ